MDWRKGEYLISTDKTRLQLAPIHEFLTRAYWSRGIDPSVVETSIAHSLCFGLYAGPEQIGFARLVTDEATFAYLSDVFVLEGCRGKGLGKWLVSVVMEHPCLSGMRRIMLATADAHELYAEFGFKPLADAGIFMELIGRKSVS